VPPCTETLHLTPYPRDVAHSPPSTEIHRARLADPPLKTHACQRRQSNCRWRTNPSCCTRTQAALPAALSADRPPNRPSSPVQALSPRQNLAIAKECDGSNFSFHVEPPPGSTLHQMARRPIAAQAHPTPRVSPPHARSVAPTVTLLRAALTPQRARRLRGQQAGSHRQRRNRGPAKPAHSLSGNAPRAVAHSSRRRHSCSSHAATTRIDLIEPSVLPPQRHGRRHA